MQNYPSICNIIVELINTNSRNEKTNILLKYKDYDLLKRVFYLAYDPSTVFYIRKIPSYSIIDVSLTLEEGLDKLSALSEREVTGNNAIIHLKYILSHLSHEDAVTITHIIEKNLNCGISTTTINKVWPKLISTYPVMLAEPYNQKYVDKINFPTYVQLKCDGCFINITSKNNIVEFRTRLGNIIDVTDTLLYIAAEKLLKCFDYPVVLTGELVMVTETGALMPRKKSNGIVNKILKGTGNKSVVKDFRIVLWDIIPQKDFHNNICTIPYNIRFTELEKNIFSFKDNIEAIQHYIDLVPYYMVKDIEEVNTIFNHYIATGYEGVMLKKFDMPWENKRSQNIIKFKAVNDIDARVIDWISGTGKYTGLLGALVCESGDITFNVGTGFSDAQRKLFTKEYIIGKIIACKYNEIITDKRTNNKSLFLPVFDEVRFDKDEV